MNTATNIEADVHLSGAASELTQIRRKLLRPELDVRELQYHLFKPRSSRHPLLRSAYELWRDGWQATLAELEGITKIHSDDFGRQDEIGLLSVGGRCVSVTGLRWLDLSLPMAREDSYFEQWPEAIVRHLGDKLVGIPSNLVVHSEWRRTLIGETRSPRRVSPNIKEVPNACIPILPATRPSLLGDAAKPGTDLGHEALVQPPSSGLGGCAPLSLASLALAIRRFIDSPAEEFIGVARNDRSMNRMAAAIGGVKLGETTVHGINSDLICITRETAAPQSPVVDALWQRRDQE